MHNFQGAGTDQCDKAGPTSEPGPSYNPTHSEDERLEYVCKLSPMISRTLTSLTARSLDENLHTREGPVRNFMILARYCSRTVFQGQMETIRRTGSVLWPHNLFRLVTAWASFMRVELKLSLYEYYISFRRFAHLPPIGSI